MIDFTEQIEFQVVQGANLEISMVVTDDADVPINLGGCSAKMQIRQTFGGSVLAESSTANLEISITPLTGTVSVSMAAAKTATLAVGDYVADVFLTFPTGVVKCILRIGPLHVLARVTQ